MIERQKRLIEVYEYLRRYFGIHTKTGFAEALHYGRTSMSAAMNGYEKYLTDSLFKNICEAFPGVFDLHYLLTGEPTAAAARTSTINVPASYAGTTGQLITSIFGICGDDYTTDVSVTASDANSQAIASVALDDVPMKRNTTTSYSGPLFSRKPTFTMTVAASWGEDITDTW